MCGISNVILYFNRIPRADWLLAAWHELILLLRDAKKIISLLGRWGVSHIPSRAMMCISYPLLGNQLYLISPLGQSSISHIPSWAVKCISISMFRFSYPKYRINTLLDSGFMNMKIPDSRISYHIRPNGLMWYEILSSGICHIYSAFVQ